MKKKAYWHNPPHIFIDDTAYFLTTSTYMKRPLLQQAELKRHLFEVMQSAFERFAWKLQHWVILNNHYHLLAQKSAR